MSDFDQHAPRGASPTPVHRPPAQNGTDHSLVWYQASVASFTIPLGILTVLFPYLVAVYLNETPERVGLAQTAFMLPGLAALLVGGFIADRMDQRRMLIILHLLNIVPVAVLMVCLWLEKADFTVMILFALVAGSTTALVQPVLDAMINHISKKKLQGTITITVSLWYLMNLASYLVASRADQLGIIFLLGLHIILMGAGVFATARLPAAPPSGKTSASSPLSQIADGFRVVLQSRRMLPPTLLVFFSGLFVGGPYAVLVPLILRDIYQGGASEIAYTFSTFMAGGAVSTLWFVRNGHVDFPGRPLLLGYVLSGVALFIWSLDVPLWGFLMATGIWGIGSGMCISMGRAIMQEAAPPSHRARVLSVYYLCAAITRTLSSFATGYLVAAIGARDAAFIPALFTFVFCGVLVAVTNLWNDRAQQ